MNFTEGNGTIDGANNFNQNFAEIFSRTSEEIENLLTVNQPDKALEKLMLFIWTANSYGQTKANIIGKLTSIIGNLKKLLESIAKKTNATSFSISVSAPLGLSVSVTWNINE